MQQTSNTFLAVAARVSSSSFFNDILQNQHNAFDFQAYKIETSSGENMAKLYLNLTNRFEFGNKSDEDPDNWNQNQRRLFVWFIVCYSYFLQQDHKNITPEAWQELSPVFFNKKPQFLRFQYLNLLKNKSRVAWNNEEDQLLTKCTLELRPGKWNAISKKMFYDSNQTIFRTPKHCRERWLNHLDQSKKHGEWTNRQDLVIFEYTLSKGKRWSKIVDLLEGTRTEHMIKNRYNSLVAKWRGTKKQKEEDVARKILAMLSKTESGPLKDQKITQSKQNVPIQDKKLESQLNEPCEQEREKPNMGQFNAHPPLPHRYPPPMPYGWDFNPYNPYFFFNQMYFNNYGLYRLDKEEDPMFRHSRDSNFSTYKPRTPL